MRRAALTALLLLGSTIPAFAGRIDIDDPALLGSVLFSINVNRGFEYERLITEVRYAAGTYSYVYAVQTSPYFPLLVWDEGEPSLVSVAVEGRPLAGTWGAIYTSASVWGGFNSPTNIVESITPSANDQSGGGTRMLGSSPSISSPVGVLCQSISAMSALVAFALSDMMTFAIWARVRPCGLRAGTLRSSRFSFATVMRCLA